jgi:hypothetical protein
MSRFFVEGGYSLFQVCGRWRVWSQACRMFSSCAMWIVLSWMGGNDVLILVGGRKVCMRDGKLGACAQDSVPYLSRHFLGA